MFLRLFLLLIGIGVVLAGLAFADYSAWLKQEIQLDSEPTAFAVERGWSAKRVSRELVANNILDKPWWFDVYARWSGKAVSIKAGDYTLRSGLTPPALLEVLMTGQSKQYSLGIIEGSTFVQVRKKLEGESRLKQTIAELDADEIMKRIGKPGLHPEGQFFSDTYQFPKDSDDIKFLQRASAMLDKVLDEEWQARQPDLPLASPYEALILASIVEKETAVAEERPLIAGVFLSRLIKKMRLQTDPTVIYGIGEKFDGNIRRKDLKTDTPYNTYTRGGLPPTPISMVGREAIHAVMHPTETKSLYFVAKGDGTHQFSETVEQHNAAVRKYQLKKK